MLWEPCIIDGHKAVRINSGHPYYHKVYVPNLASGVTVQGMDSLLWALCSAELGTITEATARYFSELRFEVSAPGYVVLLTICLILNWKPMMRLPDPNDLATLLSLRFGIALRGEHGEDSDGVYLDFSPKDLHDQ